MNDTLQERLIKIKQEIIALKTAKKAGLLLKTNIYIEDEFIFATGLSKITYEDGVQPIITTNNSDVIGTMFSPEGNVQYFYFAGNSTLGTLNLQSTRKILSVEWVSP